jgi:hypothetical protein
MLSLTFLNYSDKKDYYHDLVDLPLQNLLEEKEEEFVLPKEKGCFSEIHAELQEVERKVLNALVFPPELNGSKIHEDELWKVERISKECF